MTEKSAHDCALRALMPALQLVADMPQPAFAVSSTGEMLRCNSAFAALLGCDSLSGRPIRDVLGDSWAKLDRQLALAFDGQSGLAPDVTLQSSARTSRAPCICSFSFTPMRDSTGKIQAVLGLVVDRTADVETTRTMALERDRLATLFEQAPGFIAFSQGPEHCFTIANAAYRKLVGREQLVGLPVADALPELVEQGFIDMLDEIYEHGEPVIANDLPVDLKRGSLPERRMIDAIFQPVRAGDGEIIGIFAEGQDVTQRVQDQASNRRLQSELIHLSRQSAMGTMATTMAHELSQPLTAITSFAGAAERQLASADGPDVVRPLIEGIKRAALSASTLLKRQLAIGRVEAPRLEPFELKSVLRDAVSIALAGQEHVQVIYDLEACTTCADRVQVQQVLVNLIRNALEATSGRTTPVISLSCRSRGEEIVLGVQDNGTGIDPSLIDRMFDSFVTSKPRGIGIGLSISRTIIEAHHGRIWGENVAEGGARISFTLPRQP